MYPRKISTTCIPNSNRAFLCGAGAARGPGRTGGGGTRPRAWARGAAVRTPRSLLCAGAHVRRRVRTHRPADIAETVAQRMPRRRDSNPRLSLELSARLLSRLRSARCTLVTVALCANYMLVACVARHAHDSPCSSRPWIDVTSFNGSPGRAPRRRGVPG